MDNLKDVAKKSQQSQNSTSSSGGSSGGSSNDSSDYPKYYEETPFLVVYEDGDSIKVRNRPSDIVITYREYQKGSDLKKFDVPDEIVEYWMTDWGFKAEAHRYEKQTDRESFLDDLRDAPVETLRRLKRETGADTNFEKRTPTCAVCGEELMTGDSYEIIQGKRVHSGHTAQELVSNDVLATMSNRETSEENEYPDTTNREWD